MAWPNELQSLLEKANPAMDTKDFQNLYESVLELIFGASYWEPFAGIACARLAARQFYNAWFYSEKQAAFHRAIAQVNNKFFTEKLDSLTSEVKTGLEIIAALFNLEASTTYFPQAAVDNASKAVRKKYGFQYIQVNTVTALCTVKEIKEIWVLVIG